MKNEPVLIISVDHTEDHSGFTTYLRVKRRDGSSQTVSVKGCVPRFWTEKDPSDLDLPSMITRTSISSKTTITGDPLFEIRVEKPSDIRSVRDFLYPHYCADVGWPTLVRWIYGWTAVIEIDSDLLDRKTIIKPANIKPSEVEASEFDLSVVWFDIETEDSLDMENAPERIVSIAIMDSVTGIHEVATTVPASERQVQRMLGSQKVLEDLVSHDQPIPPIPANRVKVVSLDHSDPDTNEAALLWWFKERIESLDRDLIGGQNVKGYDIPYLKNRAIRMRRQMDMKYSGSPPVFHTFPDLRSVLRRPVFDSKIAYTEQVQGAAATTGSGSLAWMATSVLGYGKVPRSRITDLMAKDPVLLAAYNIWDNVCVARCMTELKLIPFYVVRTAFHNSTIHKSHTNMMLIEDALGHELMKKNMVMPSISVVQERMVGSFVEGGAVMDNPVGVFLDSMELDNSMEYPAQIINGNLSPDTIVDPEEYPNGFPFKTTTAPSGRIYRRDREGIIPMILKDLADGRKQTQQAMRDARDQGDHDLAEDMNRKQRVQKESMNSYYGVMASGTTEKTRKRPFRLVNAGIASDITEGARLHNQWNKDLIEKTPLWFSPIGIEPFIDQEEDDGIRLDFHVIGQDTDSCKVTITNHTEAINKVRLFTEEDIRTAGNLLCFTLNGSYDEFCQNIYGIPKNQYLYVKPDAFYQRFFSWGVKKRYAYIEYDGKQSFRGVEIRRSSAPEIVKSAQKRVFDAILSGCDRKDLNNLLRQIHEDLLDPEITPSIHFGQPFGVKKPNTFAHRAAMWSNKHIDTEFDIGDKPVLFMASSSDKGGVPKNRIVAIEWGETPESFGIQIDRQASFDKHFVKSKSWIGILNAFQTSWQKALAGMSQASMDEWFN